MGVVVLDEPTVCVTHVACVFCACGAMGGSYAYGLTDVLVFAFAIADLILCRSPSASMVWRQMAVS